jgi:hypothetical protein
VVDKDVGVVLTPYRGADKPGNICPICHGLTAENPRYPDHLCRWCSGRAVDSRGRELEFGNISVGGGFEATYADDGSKAVEVTETHICYVGYLKVFADEARFGGIVLVPYGDR